MRGRKVTFTMLAGSNRTLSRRFYSPILLFEAYAPNVPLCVPRRDSGLPPSAMRGGPPRAPRHAMPARSPGPA